MDAARTRLSNERKDLASNRPMGCFLKPRKNAEDGSVDLFCWEGGIKPLPSSPYALPDDGTYSIRMKFKPDFPASPPEVSFLPPIFHTNCFSDGRVCLSLLLQQGHHPGAGHKGFWQATLRLGDILRALQTYLEEPNPESIVSTRREDNEGG
jgi:ubiquitin-protein ligase